MIFRRALHSLLRCAARLGIALHGSQMVKSFSDHNNSDTRRAFSNSARWSGASLDDLVGAGE